MSEALQVSVSEARRRLSEIVMRVQDPRGFCVLTRHGEPVAGIVSMAELQRIWDLTDLEEVGPRSPLTGGRSHFRAVPGGMVQGPKGLMTYREAAERVQRVQMDRAAETAVLRAGGLRPVEGGELASAPVVEERRGWVERVLGWFRVGVST